MARREWASSGLVAAGLLLAGCGGGSPAVPAEAGAGEYEAGPVLHFPVTTHDGVVLDGYVHLPKIPAGQRVPVVLHSTPYPGTCPANHTLTTDAPGQCYPPGDDPATSNRIDTTRVVKHGYAVAHMNVRGTGLSGGCFATASLDEQKDQVVLVEALANAPWSSGHVAMYGHSYPSYTAWEAAVQAPAALKTIVVSGHMNDLYTYYHSLQGLQSLGAGKFQASYVATLGLPPLGGTPPAATRDVGIRTCPDLDPETVLLREYGSDRRDEAFWAERRISERLGQVTAAVLLVSGFEDSDLSGSFHSTQDDTLWAALRSPKRGLWGHWGHELPPPAAQMKEDWYDDVLFPWLDWWLKRKGNPARLKLGVAEYEDEAVGEGGDLAPHWLSSRAWPPEEAQEEVFYLGAGSATEPGRLMPSPTGEDVSLLPGGYCGDILLTAPAAEDVTLAGNPLMLLQLVSDQPTGAIDVRLVDWPPEADCKTDAGNEISSAQADLRFHAGNFEAAPFPVGVPTPVRLDFFNNAYVLRKGHQLGINFFVPPTSVPTQPGVANLTLSAAGSPPSHIAIPVVRGTLGAVPGGYTYPPRPFAAK